MHPPRRLVPLVLGTVVLVLATACGGAAGPPAAAHVAGTDVTQLVRLSLLENEVANALATAKVDLPQLRTTYQQHPEQYATITADHIVVKTEAEAETVYQQVTRPGATRADFLKLAKQVSIDPSVAQNFGALPAT